MRAVEFLKAPPPEIPPVVVISGAQAHLVQSALNRLRPLVVEDETSCLEFDGEDKDLELKTVLDELRTISMWGDRRLVIVSAADDFVSNHRASLEKYVDKPASRSVLVLKVKTWTKTTRIAKQVAAKGLEIDCSKLETAALVKWLQDTALADYQQTLNRDAANLLVDLIGDDMGMLDQELLKLASYVGQGGKITANDVRTLVGGWRLETTWKMTDAICSNDLGTAFQLLDELLTAGEAPLKLLGGIVFVFKKLALATDLSRSLPLDQALRQAGVFPQSVPPCQAYLRRIGRPRAEQILQFLVGAHAGIKGASSLSEHQQLETLIVQLAGRI